MRVLEGVEIEMKLKIFDGHVVRIAPGDPLLPPDRPRLGIERHVYRVRDPTFAQRLVVDADVAICTRHRPLADVPCTDAECVEMRYILASTCIIPIALY